MVDSAKKRGDVKRKHFALLIVEKVEILRKKLKTGVSFSTI